MPQPSVIKYLVNLGVKTNYHPWEIHLTRKLNLVSMLGIFNVFLGIFLFTYIGYLNSLLELVSVLVIAPFVFILNKRFGYIAAAYLFTFIGCYLFYFLSVKMGTDSMAFLYYFPLIIGLIQMVGRRETFHHLLNLFVMCFASVIMVIISYKYNFFQVEITPEVAMSLRYVNMVFSFFAALGFMVIISSEAIKQEKQLSAAVQQKEVLLAELFHRVKNNLNIVTSLLNLKKESIESKEGQNALEECRNLIFSMALVHDKIYNSNNVDKLDFKGYIHTLVTELLRSVGASNESEFKVNAKEVNLHISKAIPCGLILNELVTNSFKHAKQPGKKLELEIELKQVRDEINLVYRDNGPGIFDTGKPKRNTLGLELIKSLTEQLDAEHSFANDNGLIFRLKIKDPQQI